MHEFISKFQIGDVVCSESAIVLWARGLERYLKTTEVQGITFKLDAGSQSTVITTSKAPTAKEQYFFHLSEAKSVALKYLAERMEDIANSNPEDEKF